MPGETGGYISLGNLELPETGRKQYSFGAVSNVHIVYGFECFLHRDCTSCTDFLLFLNWRLWKTSCKGQEIYRTFFRICSVSYDSENLILAFSFQVATIDTEHFVL